MYFKGYLTDDLLQLLQENFIDVVFVPTNFTDQLQPLDLSVNKSVKDYLRGKFQQWYSDKFLSSKKMDHSAVSYISYAM